MTFKSGCRQIISHLLTIELACLVPLALIVFFNSIALAQDPTSDDLLIQQQIAIQKQRLNSGDVEQRRDAVLQLGWVRRAESSRVAAGALNDASAIVRATACSAVVFMPGDEAAGALIPVLSDNLPFVRQEAAFALGQTRSRTATSALVNTMMVDRYLSVRTAAAVALGQIGDQAATQALASTLKGVVDGKFKDSSKTELEFLRRAAAVSLGQIGDRGGVPELIAALSRETEPSDVRREAAQSLGIIGDPSSVSALQSVLQNPDPYLSQLAQTALNRINGAKN